jgi:hypothetical protein
MAALFLDFLELLHPGIRRVAPDRDDFLELAFFLTFNFFLGAAAAIGASWIPGREGHKTLRTYSHAWAVLFSFALFFLESVFKCPLSWVIWKTMLIGAAGMIKY